jgi:hypothetical protein
MSTVFFIPQNAAKPRETRKGLEDTGLKIIPGISVATVASVIGWSV